MASRSPTSLPDLGLFTVHHTLAVNARRHADRIALAQDGIRLTYAEMNARANQLAHALIARGVRPGDHVGILAGNTLPHVLALYAVAKAGAISAVFDVKWVARETAISIDLFHCSLLILDRAHAAQVSAEAMASLRLGAIWCDARDPAQCEFEQAYRKYPDGNPDIPVTDDSVFMYMLTSGTTGRPKGCIKTHKSYLHSCIINLVGKRIEPGMAELLVVPIYYNSGRNSLITQLSFGGTVHLRERFDPTDTLATIQNERIACLALAPQQCEDLLRHPQLDSYDKSSLRVLRKAGLPFQKRSVQAIMERITPHVFQGYGGTEFSEASILTPGEQLSKIGSAGLPLWGTEIEVAGPDRAALPPGTQGIIRVRSPSVCKGYYNDAEATAAAFHDGWYYSGDLGFLDDDGYLYISGREKNLIKTGGINVSPAEIEDVLLSFAEVADAAVIGVPDDRWGTAIKAVIELRPGARLSETDLLRRCGESLSRYKVPKTVEFVSQLSRNALGKLGHAVAPASPPER
jgi:acyl-CoA synthetase (AMP-forming)/AMP-acid ligase II